MTFSRCRALAMVAVVVAHGAAAQPVFGAATVSVPTTTTLSPVGAAGSIDVWIDNAAGVEAADIRLDFGSSVFHVTGDVALSALTAGCMQVSLFAVAGTLRVSLACALPLAGAGVLFSIPVQADGLGDSPLTFSLCSLNEGDIPCKTTNGTVVVAAPTNAPTLTPTATWTPTSTATNTPTSTATATPTPTSTHTATATPADTPIATATPTDTAIPAPLMCDVTQNGTIGALDASWILQAMAGLRTLTPEQRAAGDATGNGALSALDGTRILQWAAGLRPPDVPESRCGQ